jgi:hypothetical protein
MVPAFHPGGLWSAMATSRLSVSAGLPTPYSGRFSATLCPTKLHQNVVHYPSGGRSLSGSSAAARNVSIRRA